MAPTTRSRTRRSRGHRRRGLAPLEFVLSVPLLLFVAALLVNFGDAARWKIRTQTNARYAATRSLEFRTGSSNPPPANWQPPATLGAGAGPDLQEVGQIWDRPDTDYDLTTRAIRGQGDFTADGGRLGVKRELEMKDGVLHGRAVVDRQYHQIPQALPRDGRFRFNLQEPILDHDWHFSDGRMSLNNNTFWLNRDRMTQGDVDRDDSRAKTWYRIEPDEMGLQGLVSALETAMSVLRSNPTKLDLYPLDNDNELRLYRMAFGLDVPDFYPDPRRSISSAEIPDELLINPASLDPLVRYDPRFRSYILSVRFLPLQMANFSMSTYQSEIDRQLSDNPPLPPLPGGEAYPALQTRIDRLRTFKQNYFASLPQEYQRLVPPGLRP